MEYLTLLYVIKGLDFTSKRLIVNMVSFDTCCGEESVMDFEELDEYFELQNDYFSLSNFITTYNLVPSWIEYFTMSTYSDTEWLDETEANKLLDRLIDNDIYNYMNDGYDYEVYYRDAYEMYV